jgi:hypothetical protein
VGGSALLPGLPCTQSQLPQPFPPVRGKQGGTRCLPLPIFPTNSKPARRPSATSQCHCHDRPDPVADRRHPGNETAQATNVRPERGSVCVGVHQGPKEPDDQTDQPALEEPGPGSHSQQPAHVAGEREEAAAGTDRWRAGQPVFGGLRFNETTTGRSARIESALPRNRHPKPVVLYLRSVRPNDRYPIL